MSSEPPPSDHAPARNATGGYKIICMPTPPCAPDDWRGQVRYYLGVLQLCAVRGDGTAPVSTVDVLREMTGLSRDEANPDQLRAAMAATPADWAATAVIARHELSRLLRGRTGGGLDRLHEAAQDGCVIVRLLHDLLTPPALRRLTRDPARGEARLEQLAERMYRARDLVPAAPAEGGHSDTPKDPAPGETADPLKDESIPVKARAITLLKRVFPEWRSSKSIAEAIGSNKSHVREVLGPEVGKQVESGQQGYRWMPPR